MMLRGTVFAVSLCLAALSCSVGDNSESFGERSNALNGDITHVPVPCKWSSSGGRNVKVWDGSTVQLLTADVLASCFSWGSDASFSNPYLSGVKAMAEATVASLQGSGAVSGSGFAAWGQVRSSSSCDADMQFRSYPLTPSMDEAFSSYLISTMSAGALYTARELSFNSCMAEGINGILASGAGLSLSQEEQLELANVERVHAQAAVQVYTSMLAIAANNDAATPIPSDEGGNPAAPFSYSRLLQKFLRLDDTSSVSNGNLQRAAYKELNQDFVASLQILLESGKNMSTLMARSRSARDAVPGGSDTATYNWNVPADATWGAGSWTDRLLALNLGGDPLGITPGAAPVAWYGTQRSASFRPYVRTDTRSPQVATVLKLLRQFKLSRFKTTTTQWGSRCRAIDVAATTTDWQAALNGALNAKACPTALATCAGYSPKDLLLQDYRVTSAHVQTAAQLFADLMPEITLPGTATTSLNKLGGCFSRPAMALSGSLTLESDGTTVTLADWDFKSRGLDDIVGRAANDAVGAQGSFRLPLPDYVRFANSVTWRNHETEAQANGQSSPRIGPTGSSFWDISRHRQTLGVLPTLTAARHVLAEVVAKKKATASRLLPTGAQLVKTLDAAIGSSLYMIPNDVKTTDGSGKVTLDSTHEVVRIAGNPADTFWTDQSTTKKMYLVRIPDTAWSSDLIRSPESKFHGVNLATLLSEVIGNTGVRSPALTLDNDLSEFGRPVWTVDFPVVGLGPSTILAVRFDDGDVSSTSLAARDAETLRRCVRLLATNVSTWGNDYYHGTYLALGGALGNDVLRQLTPKESNPSEPAYDGFGLRTDWVPPFSGEGLGGNPLSSSIDYYMTSARAAGQDASQAAQRAFDGLLSEEERQYQADLTERERQEASRKAKLKAQQGLKEEKVSLCGTMNPDCKVALATTTLSKQWYSALAAPIWPVECANDNVPSDPYANPVSAPLLDPAGTVINALWADNVGDAAAQAAAAKKDAEAAIKTTKCLVRKVVDGFLNTQVQLADPVTTTVQYTSQPAFLQFSGGELQGALIEQWAAIRAPNELLERLLAGLDAAQATIEAANAQLVRQSQEVRIQCSGLAITRAIAAGWSGGFLSATWSVGPLMAQTEKCEQATVNLGPEIKRAAATNKDASASVVDRVQGLTDAATRITRSGAEIARILTQSGLAAERVALEEQLDEINPLAPMSNGLFRRYRAYDIWRARALIENARRYAVAARRAIEARYALDLSSLAQDESFVKSPSTWADEIYRYDLNLPSSIGLSTGVQAAGGIYSNVVEDYVRNLQGFVDGYPVERPTATAKGDVEVLILPGLADGVVDTATFGTGATAVSYSSGRSRGAWMVHCPAGTPRSANSWTYLSGQDATRLACDASGAKLPDAARLNFSLDPWARVNDSLANEPFDNRYNARWERMAMNLVGTAVKDCAAAADPQSCFNEGFIRYNLRHEGVAWITDFAGQWRALNLPPGVIENGKALAIEAWLDPLKNGWETPYIASTARTELVLRPFGGDYTLELLGGPDVHLERIERIQLMAGMSYWVAQR